MSCRSNHDLRDYKAFLVAFNIVPDSGRTQFRLNDQVIENRQASCILATMRCFLAANEWESPKLHSYCTHGQDPLINWGCNRIRSVRTTPEQEPFSNPMWWSVGPFDHETDTQYVDKHEIAAQLERECQFYCMSFCGHFRPGKIDSALKIMPDSIDAANDNRWTPLRMFSPCDKRESHGVIPSVLVDDDQDDDWLQS